MKAVIARLLAKAKGQAIVVPLGLAVAILLVLAGELVIPFDQVVGLFSRL